MPVLILVATVASMVPSYQSAAASAGRAGHWDTTGIIRCDPEIGNGNLECGGLTGPSRSVFVFWFDGFAEGSGRMKFRAGYMMSSGGNGHASECSTAAPA